MSIEALEREIAELKAANLKLQSQVERMARGTAQLEATVNELQTHNALMDTIFNSIHDGIVVADKDGKYVMFNETAKKMAGYNVRDVDITQASETFGLFQLDGHTIFPIDELPPRSCPER